MMTLEEVQEIDRVRWKRIEDAIMHCPETFAALWDQGDGRGGAMMEFIAETLRGLGYSRCHTSLSAPSSPSVSRKEKIPPDMRKKVMERDRYRCQHCGTHRDLSIDHIHPESLGGATTPTNLQVLCMPCNLKKGAKASS
jgi:hypothetical protein